MTEAHTLGLKVVPWTVDARDDMVRVIDMQADGLITDYPDRAREVMAAKGRAPALIRPTGCSLPILG